MNFASNRKAVLLIMRKELLSKMAVFCASVLKQEKVEILRATSGLDGILAYNRHFPCLVIVEDELPDMLGSSVCSILKTSPNGGEAVGVFFVGKSSSYLYGTNADCFFPKPIKFGAAAVIIREFFARRWMHRSAFRIDVEKAKRKQKESLPEKIETDRYIVSHIFSAFSELSGDGLSYWLGKDGRDLFGFLFDCTGHDFASFSQTSEIWSLLRFHFKPYESGKVPLLGTLLANCNDVQFSAHEGDPVPVEAVLFHISSKDSVLRCCSAGMPCFYADRGGGYERIVMRNPLIGAWRGAKYQDQVLPLTDLKRILFTSDGLSEILESGRTPSGNAKHDDVSGIAIDLKRM